LFYLSLHSDVRDINSRGQVLGTSYTDVAAQVTTDSVFRVVGRERLFDASGYATRSWRGYDVLPDAQAFVMLTPGAGGVGEVDDLVLVENLFQLLNGSAPN